jgi:hypothetical protein
MYVHEAVQILSIKWQQRALSSIHQMIMCTLELLLMIAKHQCHK